MWIGWTGTNCSPSTPCTTASITVSSLESSAWRTANFYVPLTLTIYPSDVQDASLGETVTTTVYTYGGTGSITLSVNPPAGIQMSFYTCNPVTDQCTAPIDTITFPSSVIINPPPGPGLPTPPPGQAVILQITVRADRDPVRPEPS